MASVTRPPFTYPEVPLHELLRASRRRFPEKAAVIFEDRVITYTELEARVNRLARALLACGVRRGERVIASTYNRPEFIECFYATSMAGGVIVPMNPSYKPDEMLHQITDAEARVALLEGPMYEKLQPLRSQAACLETVAAIAAPAQAGDVEYEAFIGEHADDPPPEVDLDVNTDLAALIYSSGTTGRARGVMLTHRNLACSHFQYIYAGGLTPEDISLIFLPFVHVYGIMLMNGMIAAGGAEVLLHRYNLEKTLELAQRHRVTLYYVTTSVLIELGQFPRLGEYDLSSIRYINSGGAPLPIEVRKRISDLTGLMVADGYGLTEAPLVGHHVPAEERKIVDPEDGVTELPAGESGELIVRGDHIMQGYWRDPEATAAVLRNGWLYTGDIGVIDTKGRLRLVDRKKEMIKYKGFAISPSEIEGALLDHPAVMDCAVVGIPDPETGEAPKAYVVLKESAALEKDELQTYLRERLAEYKQVRSIEFLKTIPRNHYGKILKRELT